MLISETLLVSVFCIHKVKIIGILFTKKNPDKLNIHFIASIIFK